MAATGIPSVIVYASRGVDRRATPVQELRTLKVKGKGMETRRFTRTAHSACRAEQTGDASSRRHAGRCCACRPEHVRHSQSACGLLRCNRPSFSGDPLSGAPKAGTNLTPAVTTSVAVRSWVYDECRDREHHTTFRGCAAYHFYFRARPLRVVSPPLRKTKMAVNTMRGTLD